MPLYPVGNPYISPYDAAYDSFGTLRLTETGPAQTFDEPLSLEDVKLNLRLDDGDTDDDSLLCGYISAARAQAEILQNRDLVRKQWDLLYDYWPEYRIRLRASVASVDLVQYKDLSGKTTTMMEDADYVVDLRKEPALITPPWNGSWPSFTPWPSSAILIRFTSGLTTDASWWAGTGQLVKAGMHLLVTHWYERRLPFDKLSMAEAPFQITACLSAGALKRVR